MLFEYKAVNRAGQTYTSTMAAPDKYALARMLKEKGETIISAEERVPGSRPKRAKGDNIMETLNILLSRVKDKDKIIFSRNLAAMVDAGLTVSRGLEVMERQTRNPRFKKVLAGVHESVQKGNALSVALADYPKIFSSLFISMIKSGEESGNLTTALENLGVQMEKSRQLKKRIRGAMMYPSIVITAMIIVGIVLLVVVVPTLTETFDELNVELPASTLIIIGTSNFMKDNILVSILLLAMVVALFVFLFKNPRTKRGFEWVFLHTPVIGELVRFANAARTARTLGSLLSSGVEIVTAVDITYNVVQNSYFKAVIKEASAKIPKGEPISNAFTQREDLFPPLLGEMVSVGEEAGNLPEMLDRVATFYEGEVDERTKNLSTIIEPVLMLIIGSIVGFFAVSMISPIYSISGSI